MSPPLPEALIFNILKARPTSMGWLWHSNPSGTTALGLSVAKTSMRKHTSYVIQRRFHTKAHLVTDENLWNGSSDLTCLWKKAYVFFCIDFLSSGRYGCKITTNKPNFNRDVFHRLCKTHFTFVEVCLNLNQTELRNGDDNPSITLNMTSKADLKWLGRGIDTFAMCFLLLWLLLFYFFCACVFASLLSCQTSAGSWW